MKEKHITQKIMIACAFISTLLFTATGCTGCGNMGMGPGNYEFKKVHINMGDKHACVEIEKWYDNERGVEVKIKDGDALFLSEGTYILLEETCPICDKTVN